MVESGNAFEAIAQEAGASQRLRRAGWNSGDGIMSVIDFDMVIDRLPDPKGDRVKITMSGKFLPYRYYGAGENEQGLGYQEE